MGSRLYPFLATAAAAVLFSIVMAIVCLRLPIDGAGGYPGRLILGGVWIFFLVVSLSGWGAITTRALAGTVWRGWGLRSVLGIAAVVAIGGVLNLTWATSDLSVSLILSVGAVAATVHAWSDRRAMIEGVKTTLEAVRTQPAFVIGGAFVLLLAVVQVAGSVHGVVSDVIRFVPFDIHDDNQAYLVFAEKLLETGSLGVEPFEARRMLSLGGQSFLQTLVLTVLPLRCLHLLDAGVALVIIMGLLWGAAARGRMDRRLALMMMVVALTIPHLEARGNTSTLLTGSALLLGWFLIVHENRLEGSGWIAGGVIGGLLAGALVAIKSTFLPLAGLFYLLTIAFGLLDRHRRPGWYAAEAGTTATTGAVILAPWMVSLYHSSGTLFYPLLGHGYFGGQYSDGFSDVRGAFDPVALDYVQALVRLGIEISPLLILMVFTGDRRKSRAAPALVFAALASVVLYVLATDPELNRSLYRYVFPGYVAALLAALVAAFDPGDDVSTRRPRLSQVAGLAVAVWIVLTGMPETGKTYVRLAANIQDALSGADFVSTRDRAVYREMLHGVPPDARVLTRLRFPFLLDPEAARIMVMGFPGMASPPPGMPLRAGGDALSEYLLAQDIRYLAYTYAPITGRESLLNLTPEQISTRYPRSRVRWAILRYHEDYHARVRELMATRKRLFDSGDNVVLDLASPVVTLEPGTNRPVLLGLDDNGWTDGTAEAIDVPIPQPTGPNRLRIWTHGWHPFHDRPELLDPAASLDGKPMTLIESDPRGFLFEFAGSGRPTGSITIESATFTPEQVGARGTGATLGIDIKALELYGRDVPVHPIETPRQHVGSTILPEQVVLKSNFHRDNNWTNGDGVIRGISYSVRETDERLVVARKMAHPFLDDIERLALRVFVNGIELRLLAADTQEFSFSLYDGLVEVNEIRITSSTFVPSDLGTSKDKRTLGFSIRSLSFTAGE